jgi:glycosyltransferase involved in cell wall biosynthesis
MVMPTPSWPQDEPDVLRVPRAELEGRAFWQTQGVEAVILYSWADPRYTRVACAIHEAGVRLFVNMDTGGLMSPFVEGATFCSSLFRAQVRQRGLIAGTVSAAARIAHQLLNVRLHLKRLQHMAFADVVGAVSPMATERIRKYARLFGRQDVADKTHFVSHPIDPTMRYDGTPKEERVVVVGRWDDPVKQPPLLIAVASQVLGARPDARMVIVGKQSTRCADEIVARVACARGRVIAHERLSHAELCREMGRAQVSLCTSFSEGFHTVSGEALLCGCSVVSCRSPRLPSLQYFADGGRSGRMCEKEDGLADALAAELADWAAGRRDGRRIADEWRDRVAAPAVLRRIEELLLAARPVGGG